MLPASIIIKKRDGLELSPSEIQAMVDGFTRDEVADYQMSAFAMAICCRGMTADETAALTMAMAKGGLNLPRESPSPPRLDKHSTGGLGDKVSLILAPLLAAAGAHVPMISGRGLGITGGTLDKLESIPGFLTQWEPETSLSLLNQAGCCIIGASHRIAPADRRLYALRDVTGTVESVALITASILSKKLAASLDALVMDVKVGCGAFMADISSAQQLADSLVKTGTLAGLPMTAVVSDMNQPLGRAVGNAIEVNEALEVLQGHGPEDTRQLTLELASHAMVLGQLADSLEAAQTQLAALIDDGTAYERFQRMVAAQGGRLQGPLALHTPRPVVATCAGYVRHIDCRAMGELIVALGGGRRRANDRIDHRVGIEMQVRLGDSVGEGQPLAMLHCSGESCADMLPTLRSAFEIGDEPAHSPPLIHQVLSSMAEDS